MPGLAQYLQQLRATRQEVLDLEPEIDERNVEGLGLEDAKTVKWVAEHCDGMAAGNQQAGRQAGRRVAWFGLPEDTNFRVAGVAAHVAGSRRTWRRGRC